jgi:hypothetical protein
VYPQSSEACPDDSLLSSCHPNAVRPKNLMILACSGSIGHFSTDPDVRLHVPIAGPLILQSDHQTLDLTPFAAGVAIPTTTLNHVTAHRCDGSAVVTVENSTSFNEFIAAKSASILAIYTGGFAGPAVVGTLRKIRAGRPELPFFHWGDLDVGGLRILAHLRKSLGEVELLAMDGAVCDLYLGRSQPLNANEREGLTQLRAESLLIDCVELSDHLLKIDRKLEQEAVEASLCVKTLQLKSRLSQESSQAEKASRSGRRG